MLVSMRKPVHTGDTAGSSWKETSNRFRNTVRRTSYTEYEVDALAHMTEEGRGDRRNVRGELHTSEEPRDSE
jgi:hypothetical protein